MSEPTYYAEVYRQEGTLWGLCTLYKGDDVYGQWKVLTGNKRVTDPTKFGGPTPPISWKMVTRWEKQPHPTTGKVRTFAAIQPADMDHALSEWSARSYSLRKYPFMFHGGSDETYSSTGCPCFGHGAKKRDAQAKFNEAYDADGEEFIIDVFDQDYPVDFEGVE